MSRASRLVAVLAFVFLLTFASTGKPQEKKRDDPRRSGQDVVKLRAELVQIDVAVTDRNNKPVTGLKREDFELYDNNKLQAITHFSLEQSTSTALRIEDDTETPRSLPRAITATELKRVIAFVVDTMHMKPENVYRARATLQEFLDKKMEAGDLVLILATGGGSGVFQQFTSDQRILRAAINRLRPFIFSNSSTPFRSLERSSMIGMAGRIEMAGMGRPGLIEIDPLEAADARATLGTLNNMIRAMSTLPGRKISVFISEGFRVFNTQTSHELNETIGRAARANVVFHSIDPRGLDPVGLTASDQVGAEDLDAFLNQKRDDFRESQDSLNTLAVDTGGKFYRNSNDIKQMLDNLVDESSSYYLLGFQPEEEKWDGKYHKIKVAVRNRPELRVSTRKGYLARTEKRRIYSDPKVAEMVEAINSPLVRRDIDLQLTPFYRDNPKRQATLLSLLHIDATRLSFKDADGKLSTKLEVVGLILGPNGALVDRFSNTVELNLRPETHQEILKRGLLSTRVTNVKAGIYQVRMFVREADSGRIGTANNYVEIPDLKGDRLALSSIFLDPRYDSQGQMVDDVGNSETLSQRRYRPGRHFTYSLVVYNARPEGKTNQPQLEMRTRILSAGRAVYDSKYHPMQIAEGSIPPSRIVTGGIIQLGALGRGEYILEVTARDKLAKKDRGLVRQEMDFNIE